MRLNFYYSILMFVILLFSSCSNIRVDREFSRLRESTQARFGNETPIKYDFLKNPGCVEEKLQQGISREHAVGVALENNKDLQAMFENLGIAKADLVQAGLFSNPQTESLFVFDKCDKDFGASIDGYVVFPVSDLWKVPFQLKVGRDQLEIVSLQIFQKILDVRAHAQNAYNAILIGNAMVQLTQDIYNETSNLRDRIYYRKKFGFVNDLEANLVDALVAEMKHEVYLAEGMLKSARADLRSVMGIFASYEDIVLTEPLDIKRTLESPLSDYIDFALDFRPEVQTNLMEIKASEDLISLEKSRIASDVNIGLAFERNAPLPTTSFGPGIQITIPFFDFNQAQIARAQFILRRAEKQLLATKIKVSNEIHDAFAGYEAAVKSMDAFESGVFPAYKDGLAYTMKYAHRMQLKVVLLIETTLQYYQSKKTWLELLHQALDNFVSLERAIGKKIL